MKSKLFLGLMTVLWGQVLTAEEYYLREEIPLPEGAVMEIGSIALMPEKKIAVTTRRGDLWICEGAYGEDLSKVTHLRGKHRIGVSCESSWPIDGTGGQLLGPLARVQGPPANARSHWSRASGRAR